MKSTSDMSKSIPDTGTGEWSVFKYHKLRVLDQPDGVSGSVVAEAQTEEQAEQIVRDHNALPGLVAALKATVHAMQSYQFGNSSPDLANEIEAAVRNALAAAGVRR
jgi:hypothetical protein